MNVYEELRQILDAHPSGAPKSNAFDEILKTLYTPEEATLAVRMSFKPKSAEAIAQTAGLPVDVVRNMLEGMCERGVIFSRDKKGVRSYGLLPTIPGLFEFPFMRGETGPMEEKLAMLWEEYHQEALGEAFSGNPSPAMRVIPVEKSLASETHVHPYEEVARLIEETDYRALTNCACRVSLNRCDAPLEVCLSFGDMGRFLVERGFSREISKEEAMRVLDLCEEAGLVHTSNNSADKANLICNCCPCCCSILRGRTELDNPHAFATSTYEARIDIDGCTGCGICADDRCPMKAIEIIDDVAVLTPERCIGCGLCVSACPIDAIELIKRKEPPEIFATGQELTMKMAEEKGKLDAFFRVLQR
ncbi:MAG: 4Fe-4S binding protein [Deltaproteobacteria bacterium]|nr:4Fe-4S binding protein [Deltaproteobacteria bacterium]